MKRLAFGLGAVLLAVCLPVLAMAQGGESPAAAASVVPNLVRISGELTDAKGNPLHGVVGVTFLVYAAEKGGPALWWETQNVQAGADGQYSAALGTTEPEGIPAELFRSGEARWLGVQVEGQPEERRTLLVSVPYALKAKDAETLGGLPAAAFALAPVKANLPPSSAGGEGTGRGIAEFTNPTGQGTPGSLPIWSTDVELGNSAFFQTGTGASAMVGLGTTLPATLLDVNGVATFRQRLDLQGRTGTATTPAKSPLLQFSASSFKAGVGPIPQNFFWNAEPVGNNTATPTSKLSLLSQVGTGNDIETGFSFAPSGIVTFAAGQTFPGTIASVTATSPITASTTAGAVSVALDQTALATALNSEYAQLGAANTFTQPQTIKQGLTVGMTTSGPVFNAANGFYIGGTPFDVGTPSIGNASLGFSFSEGETGKYNIGVGLGALSEITAGSNNVAAGVSSLSSVQSGLSNTAVGFQALQFATSNFNTAVGSMTGRNPSGTQNIGDSNTFLGYNAGIGTDSAIVEGTAIGANAKVSESYTMILGGTAADAVNVGIGTASPFNDYALDVDATTLQSIDGGVVVNGGGGNLYLGMTNNVHKFRVDSDGEVHTAAGVTAGGADFAESVAVRGKRSGYEPGDLLAIDSTGARRLALAATPYSTMVAGIYSTKPAMLGTPHDIDDPRPGTTEIPLAVVGIVPCKVTAENGAIRLGDLLVTSSRAGFAMKGTDRRRMLGAVVGKALEPLPKGSGVIQVLVTLQ